MSRIRSIHPGLWTDEAFVSLSPFARLLFMGIWNECDDQGAFEWSPLKLKMRLLPADNVDAAELLAEIETAKSVMRYTVSGKTYGVVRNFTRFQRPKKPNAVHPVSPLAALFAGKASEPDQPLDEDSSEEVPDQFPTNGEISPQMEEEGGRREEISASNDADGKNGSEILLPEHVVSEWNQVAGRVAKPRVRDITPERRQLVRARIAQYSIDDFVDVFGKVERSPFLRGDTGGWRGCTFDWVMKKSNFQKILEGNYDQ